MTQNHPIRTFVENDPRQFALRCKLARMDDFEIVTLENDLECYARTGLLSNRLSDVLKGAPEMEAA